MSKRRFLRDGRQRGWSWIENRAVDDLWIPFVGVHAWAVYTVLLRFADEAGHSFPSAAVISELTGISVRQVRTSLKLLLSAGLIRRTKKGGPTGASVYQVRNVPETKNGDQPVPTKPQREAPRKVSESTADFLSALDGVEKKLVETAEDEPKPSPKKAAPKKVSAKRKSKLPAGWAPNSTHREIAEREGVDLDREVIGFRDHAEATGRLMLDWDAAFRTWLRNARQFSRDYYKQSQSGPNSARNEVAQFYDREELV